MVKILLRKFFDSLGRETLFPRGAQDEIITDEIVVNIDYNFKSTLQNQVTIEDTNTVKLSQGEWTTIAAGDVVVFDFTVNKLNPATGEIAPISPSSGSTATVQSVEGDKLIFATPIFVGVVGEVLPSTYNDPLTLTFDPIKAPKLLDTFYNLILNENDGGRESLIDGSVNRVVFDVDGMALSDERDGSILGDKSGGALLSAKVEKVSETVNNYKLTFKYWNWLKFELLDFNKPSFYQNDSSIKPYFEIIARRELQNPNIFTSNKFSFLKGNLGWYKELYNQGEMPWSFKSVIFKDTDDNVISDIDFAKNTNVEIILESTADFDDECIVSIYRLPQVTEEYKNLPTSFQDNVYATIAVNDTGVTVQNFGLNGAELDITGLTVDSTTTNELKITFTTVPNAEYTAAVENTPENERFYRLGVTAQLDANTWSSDLARTGLLTEAPIIGGEIEEVDTFGFLNHAEPISSCGCIFTSAFTEDDIVARAVLNLNKADNYESFRSSFRLVKDSTGEFFELWQNGRTINMLNFPIDNNGVRFLDYSEDLGYNLPAIGRNTLELKYTGNQTSTTYEVNFLQTLILSWRYWVAKPQALSDFLDFELPNNGLNDEWVRYAQEGFSFVFRIELVKDGVTYFKNYEIEINNYDSTSVVSDINLKTSSNDDVNVIVNGDVMTIEAIHVHPDPWDIDNLWGFIAERGVEQDPRPQISTEWAHTQPNAPLLPVEGLDRVKKELIDANTLKFSARVNTIGLPSDVTFVSRVQSPMVNGGIPINAFIFDVKSDNDGTSENDEFEIPTTGGGYSYNAYWYEVGNPSNNGSELGLTGNYVIKFDSEGTYRVGITGAFPRIFFNNQKDRLKLIDIIQWGEIAWVSMVDAFHGCENLTTFTANDSPNLTGVSSIEKMFRGCINLIAQIGHWNVSNIVNFTDLFLNAQKFNTYIGDWDVSNGESFSRMFQGTSSVPHEFNQDISKWNVSKGRLFNGMFEFNGAFNQDITGWNMINATNTRDMFRSCPFNFDISVFNMPNNSNYVLMFRDSAFNHNLGSWVLRTAGVSLSQIFQAPSGVGMSTENYTDTLVGWANYVKNNGDAPNDVSMTLQSNRVFDSSRSGGAEFADAGAARDYLINIANWSITGDSVI